MPNTVKWFTPSQTGIPQLTRAHTSLIDLLDACLVNGFNTNTITSMTRSGSTVTVNFASAHGFVLHQVVKIAGADQAEYNGDQRVTSVATLSFTFTVEGTPATPATTSSSMTAKAAPLGFEIVFTDTYKRVYRSADATGHQHVLRVDSTPLSGFSGAGCIMNRVHIGSSASDVDTLVDLAPYRSDLTSFPADGWFKWKTGQLYDGHSATTNGGGDFNRSFVIVGDHRLFFFMTNSSNATYNYSRALYAFGEFNSFKPADAWNTLLWAMEIYGNPGTTSSSEYSYGPSSGQFGYSSTGGHVILRGAYGYGYAASMQKITIGLHGYSTSAFAANFVSGQDTKIAWPNPTDYSTMFFPAYIYEGAASAIRGIVPGLHAVVGNVSGNIPDLSILDNVQNQSGKLFMIVAVSAVTNQYTNTSARVAFDITGPWR